MRLPSSQETCIVEAHFLQEEQENDLTTLKQDDTVCISELGLLQ